MSYFALLYDVVDDFVVRRTPVRTEHLRPAVEAHNRGDIVLAGALGESADTALIIFHCTEKSIAEDFARRDPCVVNGLVKKWRVHPWTVVVGNTSETSSPPSGCLQ
jgi:uncharacterized protein